MIRMRLEELKSMLRGKRWGFLAVQLRKQGREGPADLMMHAGAILNNP